MLNAEIILNYLKTNKERILHDYHLTIIGLFGSLARDEQNESSDIDIIVEFEPCTPDLYTLKSKLREEFETRFNANVDICRLRYIKPIFKNRILSEINQLKTFAL
jgi:predicted nucleotidyltransferase